jgi:hypothetical protein
MLPWTVRLVQQSCKLAPRCCFAMLQIPILHAYDVRRLFNLVALVTTEEESVCSEQAYIDAWSCS